MRALLDVNLLIALLDAAHVHHGGARTWLEANIEQGWASCPLTQNGCIRILSQTAYPGAQPPAAIATRLAEAAATHWHLFWPDDLSLLEPLRVEWRHVLGSRQLTDVYLLALAVHHGGRLVTFDRAVPLAAVPNATRAYLYFVSGGGAPGPHDPPPTRVLHQSGPGLDAWMVANAAVVGPAARKELVT